MPINYGFQALREAAKSLIVIREAPSRKPRAFTPTKTPEQIRAVKFAALRRRQDKAKAFERSQRRLERTAGQTYQRELATIRGLLQLQRVGVLWVWIDQGEIRIAKVPNYRKSRGVTMQIAAGIVTRAKFLTSGKTRRNLRERNISTTVKS